MVLIEEVAPCTSETCHRWLQVEPEKGIEPLEDLRNASFHAFWVRRRPR